MKIYGAVRQDSLSNYGKCGGIKDTLLNKGNLAREGQLKCVMRNKVGRKRWGRHDMFFQHAFNFTRPATYKKSTNYFLLYKVTPKSHLNRFLVVWGFSGKYKKRGFANIFHQSFQTFGLLHRSLEQFTHGMSLG